MSAGNRPPRARGAGTLMRAIRNRDEAAVMGMLSLLPGGRVSGEALVASAVAGNERVTRALYPRAPQESRREALTRAIGSRAEGCARALLELGVCDGLSSREISEALDGSAAANFESCVDILAPLADPAGLGWALRSCAQADALDCVLPILAQMGARDMGYQIKWAMESALESGRHRVAEQIASFELARQERLALGALTGCAGPARQRAGL